MHTIKSAIVAEVVTMVMAVVCLIGLSACGTSALSSLTGGSSNSGTGFGDTQTVTGTVYAPNGTDPIAGATVYIPASSTDANVAKALGVLKTIEATCSGTTVTCEEPSTSALVSTCSCGDGAFSLDAALATSDNTQICIEKGDLRTCAEPTCTEASCALTVSETTMPAEGEGALNIAVVTGAYDEIQDVLAKIGYGSLDEDNRLLLGSETFTIYRGGDYDLDAELAAISEETYPLSSVLFGDVDLMHTYDIIFINCGADESVTAASASASVSKHVHLSHAEYHQARGTAKSLYAVSSGIDSDVEANLDAYVTAGGKLYVTDLAYDFIEQTFAEVMDFQAGGDDDPNTAETANAAQLGTAGIVADATVNDAELQAYLAAVPSNTILDNLSPNYGACATDVNGSATSLNADNTVRIGDFLSSWAVMKAAYDATTKVWLEGAVSFDGGSEVRPLTISRAIGDNGGKVFYSSYHTSHSCATGEVVDDERVGGFWPQERVLQYFVFEVIE